MQNTYNMKTSVPIASTPPIAILAIAILAIMLPPATALTNLLVSPPSLIPKTPHHYHLHLNNLSANSNVHNKNINALNHHTNQHPLRSTKLLRYNQLNLHKANYHHQHENQMNSNFHNKNRNRNSLFQRRNHNKISTKLLMAPQYIGIFNNPADSPPDDTSTKRWLAWMTGGLSSSSHKGHSEVKMRDPVELGGLPRAERYASRDWLHNTINMPNSIILQNVRFPVSFMTIWACCISLIHRMLKNNANDALLKKLCIPTAPHSLMVSALGLLLVFRTNSAYQRFSEGRKIWEEILSIARDLSRLVKLYDGQIGSSKVRRLNRLLAAFPYLLRFRIRPNSIMKKIDDTEFTRDPGFSLILYQDHGKYMIFCGSKLKTFFLQQFSFIHC